MEKGPACTKQAGPEIFSEAGPALKRGRVLDLPVSAVGKGVEDLVSLIVTDDGLFLWVPLDGTPDLVRDVGDVTGGNGAMGIFGGRDSFLPGLDAVDGVALVAR